MISLTRTLEDGARIDFEEAPAGGIMPNGEIRRADWRAYFFTAGPTCGECEGSGRQPSEKRPAPNTIQCKACKGTGDGQRVRLAAVSSVLGAILSKDGLAPWAESKGIEGALEAVRRKLIDPWDFDADPVAVVRANQLGADAAAKDAAGRGINVHAALEEWMRTGTAPTLADKDPEHHGYYQALSRFILEVDAEPVAIEQLVAHPELGYAGRSDLLCRSGGKLIRFDGKTQPECAIRESAHTQVAMYDLAGLRCGQDEPAECRVVVFGADGEYRQMTSMANTTTVFKALAHWSEQKPIIAACSRANRAEKLARA